MLVADAKAAVKEMRSELEAMPADHAGRDLLTQQIAELQQAIDNTRAALREAPLV